MKTVDQEVKDWKNQFSGDPTEDWINHVNDLDRELACKFSWTARQFYYALKGTLRAKASTSLSNLEKGLERPNIRDFIPEWHEPDPQEWRALHDGLLFTQLTVRTQVAVLIYYFQFKYQITTPHQVWEAFTHLSQSLHESIEDWGLRLSAAVLKVESYGMNVGFDQYIHQWLVGSHNRVFKKRLRVAMKTDRYGNPPVVYNKESFDAWYQNYQEERIEDTHLALERSTLLTVLQAKRNKKPTGPSKSVTLKGK